jgi:hypothetical protein
MTARTTKPAKRATRRKPAAETPPQPGNTIDVSRQLDAIGAAYKAGVLTEQEWEVKRAPLVNALYELAAAETAALKAAGGGPLGVSINTPIVVAGELIETAWGNQVRTDLQSLNAGKVEKSGDSITGSLSLSGASTQIALPNLPTASPHATRMDWVLSQVATKVDKAGDAMTGGLSTSGIILVGGTPPAAAGIQLRPEGPILAAVSNPTSTDNTVSLLLNREGLAAGQPGAIGSVFTSYRRAGTQIGRVEIQAGPVAQFVASSDPRAKARTGPADDAAAIVAELGRLVYRGRWRNMETGEPEGVEWVMLNSTDIEQFAPFAVSGEADAVDDDGKPEYQMVGWSSLVPMLFAAISQQHDRIAALEARIA